MGRLVRTLGAGALSLLVACGGSARHSDAQAEGGSSTTSTGGSSAHTAGQAAGATDSTGEAGVAPVQQLDSFETTDAKASIGLWMGFPDDMLPIGMPSVAHDGSALHLVGETDAAGLDVFFHTGMPVERIWSSVRFWTQSDTPGTRLIVAIAGPEPSYFDDRALGVAWPQQLVTVGPEWRESIIDFSALGIGPDHLSPHSETFGAVHFIIEPNTPYDVWIDDFAGEPLYR